MDAGKLTAGDLVLIEAGQFVHVDGKVRAGTANVDAVGRHGAVKPRALRVGWSRSGDAQIRWLSPATSS